MTFKQPPLRKIGVEETNYFRFRLSPDVIIAIAATSHARFAPVRARWAGLLAAGLIGLLTYARRKRK